MKENLIDEVLREVRSAEDKADQVYKEAVERGKNIVLAAETEADRLRRDTVTECKQMRKQMLEEAEQRAKAQREAILKKGAELADELTDSRNSMVEEAADAVVRMLLEKYSG